MYSVTALTSRVVMATRMHEHGPYPERRVYIDRLTSYIDLHTTSFINNTQYLVPRQHVL